MKSPPELSVRALATIALSLSGCSAILGADFSDGHLRQEPDGGVGADEPAVDTCAADRKLCGGSCVPRKDPTYGCDDASCTPCASSPNAAAVCAAGACELQCDAGFSRCASGCCASEPTTIGAGGEHTCAVTLAGGVKCWGDNSVHQLGTGTTALGSRVPVDVVALDAQVRSVSAGNTHTCAVTVSGAVKCWGSNSRGELGDGTKEHSGVPVDVVGLTSGVLAVSAGLSFTCALMNTGRAKCWGGNSDGVLGDGTLEDSSTPVDVKGISTATAIVAGGGHVCARKASGEVACWGAGGQNQLGTHYQPSRVPVKIERLDSIVTSVAAGFEHTCALSANGLECWGSDARGQLGGDAGGASAEHVVLGPFASALAAGTGAEHSCVLTATGAKCWGYGENGRLGNDSNLSSRAPVDVVGLPAGLRSITSGPTASHTCVRTESFGIKCWGKNRVGKLGTGSLVDAWTPADVVAFP